MIKDNFKDLLNFEYDCIHRAQPAIQKDDIFEIFYEGKITKIFEPEYPIDIGLFDLDVLNLRGARKFGVYDELIMNTLGSEYDETYSGSLNSIIESGINLNNIDRIVFLKNLIILPKYRGHNILPELIKSIYISQCDKNTLFMANVRPLQSFLEGDIEEHYSDFYMDMRVDGKMSKNGGIPDKVKVSVSEYFDIKNLPENDEGHYYKLYAKMLKLNMVQMKDTSFFYYKTENDILEMIKLNKS